MLAGAQHRAQQLPDVLPAEEELHGAAIAIGSKLPEAVDPASAQ